MKRHNVVYVSVEFNFHPPHEASTIFGKVTSAPFSLECSILTKHRSNHDLGETMAIGAGANVPA